jgi:alpha-sarcoglycan
LPLKNLKSLFKYKLWHQAEADLHLTNIASSLEVGYRRPVVPTEKDGVVIQLGSRANFSNQLIELDRETSPLRVFPSCPRNFKRTSVERYFR